MSHPDRTETPPGLPQTAPPSIWTDPRASGAAGASNREIRVPAGILDFGTVDTTPGASCVFAPPAGKTLTADEYLELMRNRYRIDPGARQQIGTFARRSLPTATRSALRYAGPWAAEARSILATLTKAMN